MGRRVRILSALVAGTLAFVVGSSTAHALSGDRLKCQKAIAKEAAKYVTGKLKVIQKCELANFATPGSCLAPDAGALTKLVDKLNAGLAKACSFDLGVTDDDNLAFIGFPGACSDSNPGNGFTLGDLQACILSSHDAAIGGACGGGTNTGQACTLVADCPDTGPGTFCRGFASLQFDPALAGPPGSPTAQKCLQEVSKSASKYLSALMKNVQKCRNALLDCKTVGDSTVCKLSGIAPDTCATADAKTAAAVQKARDKAVAAITAKCADAGDVVALKLCDPDQGTGANAATCEVDEHAALADNPDPADLSDLLDYQYAQRGICGDNRRNQPTEECDGVDDSACAGDCGGALGFFPCICQNTPRTRVIESADADLDNGWSGQSHDSGIVEGGGYVADLWDCDGPGGPDVECVVGPSCNLPPHQACSPGPTSIVNADTLCPGVGNFCRTTAAAATGPHCEIDFKKRCRPGQNDCPMAGDRCVSSFHGAPLPLVAGGVAVCVVNTFTEDVVGTTDLVTGAGAVRLRQDSATFQGGSVQQPCPVCGGFCSGPGGTSGPGVRNLCTTDADCSGGATCVTANICSWGPDVDKPCRPNPPFGGPTEFFGNPSKDCRRDVSSGSALGVIDILFNPATTGSTSRTANIGCGPIAGFTGRVCAGGLNQHRSCTVDSECPGGTCNLQCFCPTAPGLTQRPNGCQAACLGGADDAQPCVDDTDCTLPGFCHNADCRVNPSDTDSAQEGLCTVGPADNRCSVHDFLSCANNAACQPPTCPFCEPTETCDAVPRQCFVNPTYTRSGSPGIPDRVTAATFCITATGESAVDGVAGLPGPGAITQPATIMDVGF